MALAAIRGQSGTSAVAAEAIATPFELTVEKGSDDVVFRVVGELDLATVDRLREPLRELADHPPGMVAVDLTRCEFMDSTAISTLVCLQRELQVDDRSATRLIVTGSTGQVRRMLELTGLDQVIDLVD